MCGNGPFNSGSSPARAPWSAGGKDHRRAEWSLMPRRAFKTRPRKGCAGLERKSALTLPGGCPCPQTPTQDRARSPRGGRAWRPHGRVHGLDKRQAEPTNRIAFRSKFSPQGQRAMGQSRPMWAFAGVPRCHATAQKGGMGSQAVGASRSRVHTASQALGTRTTQSSRVEVLDPGSRLAGDRAWLLRAHLTRAPRSPTPPAAPA